MSDAAPHRIVITPHCLRPDFLPADRVAALLDFALAHEAKFVPSTVGRYDVAAVNPVRRVSSLLHDIGPFKAEFRARLAALAPALTAELRMPPFAPSHIEVELVAHGDGAFFSRHIDTLRHSDDTAASSLRVLSGVYYFHAAPKGFSGGALRLHQFMAGGKPSEFRDIAPVHNSAVFFPAFMPHEVMPVSVPSGRFADRRFAVNFWVHRAA